MIRARVLAALVTFGFGIGGLFLAVAGRGDTAQTLAILALVSGVLFLWVDVVVDDE